MKMLVGATITLLCLSFCLPASAITGSSHKVTHHKTGVGRKAKVTRAHTTHPSKSNSHHANKAEHAGTKSQAALRTASYHPAAEPQSSGSSSASSSTSTSTSTHASSKKKAAAKKKHSRREPTQMAPTSDRVSEIQSALSRGGFYKADPTGKWDADTVDALQRFQSANGLDSSGKLDALTLQKLGLGSDVAGYSAPKGIVEHSCCSMTPSPSHAPPASQTAAASSGASSNSTGTSANASTPSVPAPAYQDPPPATGTAPGSATQQQNASH